MIYSISKSNKPIQYFKAFIGTNFMFLVILYQLLTKNCYMNIPRRIATIVSSFKLVPWASNNILLIENPLSGELLP